MKKIINVAVHLICIVSLTLLTLLIFIGQVRGEDSGVDFPASGVDVYVILFMTIICIATFIFSKSYMLFNLRNKKIIIFTTFVDLIILMKMFYLIATYQGYVLYLKDLFGL